MAAELFAEVVFPVPLPQIFSYGVPESLKGLAAPGMRCSVSFGRRQTVGLIVGLTAQQPAVARVKPLDSLLDTEPSLTPDLLELGRWIADYYYCSLGEALFAILPAGYRNPKMFLELSPEGLAQRERVERILEKQRALEEKKRGPTRGVTFEKLQVGKVALTLRTKALSAALRQEGLAVLRLDSEVGSKRAKNAVPKGKPSEIPALHAQQKAALSEISKALEAGVFKTFLLQGVTGSGKTEVYLRAISQVIERGQQAILLIPEIALTPQTVERFTSRFGDRVAVLHSRLSVGEKTLQWRRFALGEAKVAVGARSALFAPAQNLGLIVVDEEHEASYKQDEAPRYHARDAAVKRAQICGAVAILGSATPSLESAQNARSGKYGLLTLPERVNRKPLPKIRLVNLREEWGVRGEDRPILTLALEEALRQTLAQKEQAILFLNRRGFNTLTLCEKCGEQVHCPSCSIPVTSHRTAKGPRLLCHYCDWRGPVPALCPKCGDGVIRQAGLGTEKVEEELRLKFPQARVERMDLDTTRRKGSHEKILDRFRKGEIDLLVGTQMIAKGHDFPGVTLVGIVGADTGLGLPDFRASERVFQLLVQVAGRAGRAEKEGAIYLQTFNPEHPSIQAALRHDTEGFWQRELELRHALGYPPFSKLGLLVYRSKEERKAHAAAERAAAILQKAAGPLNVEVRGPAPAGIYKLRDYYRFQILLRSLKPQALRRLLHHLDGLMETPQGVLREVDLDPQSMM